MVALCSVAGCSFVFVDGPSSSLPPNVYPACDEKRSAPIADAVFSALYVAGAISAGLGSDFINRAEDRYTATELIAIDSALAAVFAVSAYYGFQRTGSCRRARAEYIQQTIQRPPPSPTPSPEGQACHVTYGCETGLVCASNRCVRFEP